jgi:outer membrane lipoprotein SlyB
MTARALLESRTVAAASSLGLQRKRGMGGAPAAASEVAGGIAPPIVHDALRSSGRALPAPMRLAMEGRLSHDLSGVQVHTDAKAAESTRAVRADAFTVGRHIVLGADKWNGGSANSILAHELVHVVQQSGAGAAGDGTLTISTPGDAAEREADRLGPQLMADRPVRPRIRASGVLFRQGTGGAAAPAQARTISGSAAAISWIDPASPAARWVRDPPPPPVITTGFVTGSSGFRFSNYLHAWVSSPDAVHLAGQDFHEDSGIYRGPSMFGIPSHVYPTRRGQTQFNDGGVEGVEFEQLTGARTISAGAAGAGIGMAAGLGTGVLLGGAIGGPPGMLIGGLLGLVTGAMAGAATANRIFNFPPIWTRIRLRLQADGTRRCQMVEHSLFPSNNFYCDLSQTRAYSALAPEQTAWEGAGWDGGNPWGISRPTVTP